MPTCLQAIRLLAAVIAKNAVGSSWRKTLGTREWSRVPDEEKHMCKEATITLMLTGGVTMTATWDFICSLPGCWMGLEAQLPRH